MSTVSRASTSAKPSVSKENVSPQTRGTTNNKVIIIEKQSEKKLYKRKCLVKDLELLKGKNYNKQILLILDSKISDELLLLFKENTDTINNQTKKKKI